MSENPVDLMKERDALPWATVIRALNILENSIYIFQRNFRNLKSFIDQIPDSYWKLNYKKQKLVAPNINAEISRLLFNYLSSLAMYMDHSRKVRLSLLAIGDMVKIFGEAIEKNLDKDKHNLVKSLINYIKHDQIVNFWHNRKYTPIEWTDWHMSKSYTFWLWTKEILWSKFIKSIIKKYVEENYEEKIDLMQLFWEHYEMMSNLVDDHRSISKKSF